MQEIKKADNKFLSTSPDWGIESILQTLPQGEVSVSLAIVLVEPREGKTGLLEERGMWIEELWHTVIAKCHGIVGYRSSWNEVVFFWPKKTSDALMVEITSILIELTVEKLKSLALFSTVSGTNENALKELERMELQLRKIGYWKKHIFDSYYEDGQEIPLHEVSE